MVNLRQRASGRTSRPADLRSTSHAAQKERQSPAAFLGNHVVPATGAERIFPPPKDAGPEPSPGQIFPACPPLYRNRPGGSGRAFLPPAMPSRLQGIRGHFAEDAGRSAGHCQFSVFQWTSVKIVGS